MFFKSKTKPASTIKERVLEKWNSIGNDFLITKEAFTTKEIIHLCDRRFGIGADQFVIMQNNKIKFFNADGIESEMCGNALKCITQVASREAPSLQDFNFELKNFTVNSKIEDGFATIALPLPSRFKEEGNPFIHITMPELNLKKERFDFLKLLQSPSNSCFSLDIGNPHFVCIIDITNESNLVLDAFFSSQQFSAIINYMGEVLQKEFLKTGGVNASFVMVENRTNIFVRTYERGVGETLSCGSGSVASAFCTTNAGLTESENIRVFNKGSEKVLAIKESYHQISIKPNNLLLKGRGTKIAKIIFNDIYENIL